MINTLQQSFHVINYSRIVYCAGQSHACSFVCVCFVFLPPSKYKQYKTFPIHKKLTSSYHVKFDQSTETKIINPVTVKIEITKIVYIIISTTMLCTLKIIHRFLFFFYFFSTPEQQVYSIVKKNGK